MPLAKLRNLNSDEKCLAVGYSYAIYMLTALS